MNLKRRETAQKGVAVSERRTVTMTDYTTREYIIRETTDPDATKQELIGELVRCKDCLHNRACEIQYHAQAGDLFFCGAAERKDGDGND